MKKDAAKKRFKKVFFTNLNSMIFIVTKKTPESFGRWNSEYENSFQFPYSVKDIQAKRAFFQTNFFDKKVQFVNLSSKS